MSGRAVVIGGSVAGTLAARVLADAFDHVTVVDRDDLPEEPVHRRGAPQAEHSHGLLARGLIVLEELFPGVTDELIAKGAVRADMQRQARFFAEGRELRGAPSDIVVLAASRPLLETHLRGRVRALPNVEFRGGCEALGLEASGDRLTGVRTAAGTLDADLVVDASGRSNRSVAWLGELGYEAPDEEVVKSGVVYATREYRRTDADGDCVTLAVALGATSPRGSAAIIAEDDRWVCTLVGMNEHAPPGDPEGFVAFAESLAVPDVHTMVARSEPLGDVVRMRMSPSVRRRYERLRRFPANYLVVGDALCHLNPTYAQGMTVCALEAVALRDALRAGTDGLPRRFFRAAGKILDAPWNMSASGDLRFPWVEGKRTPIVRVLNRYMDRLNRAAAEDPRVTYDFMRVMNMLVHPANLFAPGLLFRVLRPRRSSASATS